MSRIQEEKALSQKYMLSKIKNSDLVELTQRNVALIEAMISNDSDYMKEADKDKGKTNKYRGSVAYWMNKLKKELEKDSLQSKGTHYKDIIGEVVYAVDRSNSTHLNADGVGIKEITERIYNIPKSKLLEFLRFPDNAELKLIDIIAKKTHPTEKNKKARANISFASKFCQEACFWMFENTKYQDNFSKYDNVLKKVVPLYAKHYGVACAKLDNYSNYRNVIDAILKKSGNKISRNGFDHLLWYYFKGRL